MAAVNLNADGVTLPGDLEIPPEPAGLVVFAHGSGSSRHSPRNRQVAAGLQEEGFATLLFDLLTETESRDRRKVFDIPLLGGRLAATVTDLASRDEVADLRVGLFGASTGAAAALDAAVDQPAVAAVVSRGGRPDLARSLDRVTQPVLLIIGGADRDVLALNREASSRLADATVEVVAGAGHLFEGPGELERVAELAARWFTRHLVAPNR